MAIEIERKFLVKGEFKTSAISQHIIVQGYLSSMHERSVRVRIIEKKAFITIKGVSSSNGLSRFEWEKEITVVEARSLLKICEPGIIEKTRFIIPEKSGLFFEVDQFEGENRGLIIAEIELPNEKYEIEKPMWLGKEVTGDERYYNVFLSAHPFSKWENKTFL
ncbi:MAG TPA: CYTH domain-containing protein [Bacteroidales bacterium]